MILIEPMPFVDYSKRPLEPGYTNLLPVVHALVGRGNVAIQGGFAPSQAGWFCYFRDRLDWAFLRSHFDFAPGIRTDELNDAIVDEGTWCTIAGSRGSGA